MGDALFKLEFAAYEKEDHIATVRINRPKSLNALNSDVLRDIDLAVTEAEQDADVKVIVITGEGKAFAAGADIAAMSEMYMKEGLSYCEFGQQVYRHLERVRKPVIAAINGFALGGGCELCLACDIRIASNKAIMGLPETSLGVIPGFGGTQRLSRLIGSGRAKELIFTARHIDAVEALSMGLVNVVTEFDALMSVTKKMAMKIAENAPLAVAYAKDAINTGLQADLDTGLAIEAKSCAALFSTEDLHEGMKAFVEKRKAVYKSK